MDERYGVECPEQQFQHRQSLVKKNKNEIKQEKKMSKTESRFKSKLESLRKFQHSASTSNAVEKARAFFRSLELRHHGSATHSDHSSSSSASSSHQCDSNSKNANIHLSSSSSSSIIDDTQNTFSILTTTQDSSFNSKQSSNCIATARIIRVINPKETIVQRVKNIEQDDDQQIPSSYFNSSQIRLQKTIQPSELYFNQNNQTYSLSYEKQRNTQIEYNNRSPVSTINPNIVYSSRLYHNPAPTNYSTLPNGNYSNHEMSTSLYNYRPLVCRQMDLPSSLSSSMMSSSFHEQSDRLTDSIIRPLPSSNSSSSMSTWTQSVRRLNSEYKSTINALQQAKESLKQSHCEPSSPNTISKYANYVARGIDNLSNSETNRSMGISFCLTAPLSQDSLSLSSSSSSQISKSSIQQPKTPPLNAFSRPKIVRPLELNSFNSSSIAPLPKLEPIQLNIEKNNKVESIANIIQKFNNLNHLSPIKKPSLIIENNHSIEPIKTIKETKTLISDSVEIKKDPPLINHSQASSSPRVHFQSTVTTYELEEIPYESPPPPMSSSSSSSLASEDTTSSTSTSSNINPIDSSTNHPFDSTVQEETTYTVETIYKNDDDINLKNLLANNQQVVIIRENTTEEQFNFLQEKQQSNKQILSQPKYTINQSNSSPLTTPLFTYLNSNLKQTTPTPPPLIQNDNSKHSLDLTNNFISTINHENDGVTTNDVVTANPYTHSPPSHRLISSSSSSSTTSSSAATVLLSNHTNNSRPNSSDLTNKIPTTTITNGNSTKINNNNKSQSQLPKRTITSPVTITNNCRLKQPTTKVNTNLSKLKPPSTSILLTNSKPIKSMTTNSSTLASTTTTMTSTSSLRKSTGVTNQSSTMTNNSLNKNTQQQTSSLIPIGKRQQLPNSTTNMTDSQSPSDSSMPLGKSRVRSMVNQFNAASTSTPSNRSVNSSTNPIKRIPTPSTTTTTTTTTSTSAVNSRRPTDSTNKTTPNRPSLQRALTINNQIPVSPSSSSTPSNANNNIPSAYKRKAPLIRSTSNVKEGLLRWCQAQVAGYPNVSVTNLSSSWSDGLAFCALIHHFFPDAFDFNSLSSINRQDNFELAFRTAEERADVPRLLDVADMVLMGNTPDYKCIFTYLNSFLAKVKDIHPTDNTIQCH